MSLIKAIFLGMIQGITEFIPVSSSGHLVILNHFLDVSFDSMILFEVMLHIGTLLAVIAVFWLDLVRIYQEFLHIGSDLFYNLKAAVHNKIHEQEVLEYRKILNSNYRKLACMLLVSCIPTGILGYLFYGIVDSLNNSLLGIGLCFFVTAVLLLVIDYWNLGNKLPKDMTFSQAIGIGICQGIGVFPGISRSGITITAGLLCGFRKNFAVRYSYLLSIPTTIGALLFELRELSSIQLTISHGLIYFFGMAAATASGFLCIRFMLNFIQKRQFKIFSIYCMIIGILAIYFNFAG